MQKGDLIRKRWGRIDPHEQGKIAICLGHAHTFEGLLLTGALILVAYPGHRPQLYKPSEFELVSEKTIDNLVKTVV